MLDLAQSIIMSGQLPRIEQDKALVTSAFYNQIDLVKALLQQKVNVNYCDSERITPLMHAAKNGFFELVLLLLQHGADVSLISKQQKPLYF